MIEVELKCELFPKLLPKLQERLQHMTFDGTAHNVERNSTSSEYGARFFSLPRSKHV